jgi:hypothetical protein
MGSSSPVNALHQIGAVNIVDIQIAIDAVQGLGCSAN